MSRDRYMLFFSTQAKPPDAPVTFPIVFLGNGSAIKRQLSVRGFPIEIIADPIFPWVLLYIFARNLN